MAMTQKEAGKLLWLAEGQARRLTRLLHASPPSTLRDELLVELSLGYIRLHLAGFDPEQIRASLGANHDRPILLTEAEEVYVKEQIGSW